MSLSKRPSSCEKLARRLHDHSKSDDSAAADSPPESGLMGGCTGVVGSVPSVVVIDRLVSRAFSLAACAQKVGLSDCCYFDAIWVQVHINLGKMLCRMDGAN